MELIEKISSEIVLIKQQNEGGFLKNDIAELQNEFKTIKLLALDYDTQLKKLNAYLEEISQVASKRLYVSAYLERRGS